MRIISNWLQEQKPNARWSQRCLPTILELHETLPSRNTRIGMITKLGKHGVEFEGKKNEREGGGRKSTTLRRDYYDRPAHKRSYEPVLHNGPVAIVLERLTNCVI